MVCRAAGGSSKMGLRLTPWISLTWGSLISVVGSRASRKRGGIGRNKFRRLFKGSLVQK